jgi:hypothetical protein
VGVSVSKSLALFPLPFFLFKKYYIQTGVEVNAFGKTLFPIPRAFRLIVLWGGRGAGGSRVYPVIL